MQDSGTATIDVGHVGAYGALPASLHTLRLNMGEIQLSEAQDLRRLVPEPSRLCQPGPFICYCEVRRCNQIHLAIPTASMIGGVTGCAMHGRWRWNSRYWHTWQRPNAIGSGRAALLSDRLYRRKRAVPPAKSASSCPSVMRLWRCVVGVYGSGHKENKCGACLVTRYSCSLVCCTRHSASSLQVTCCRDPRSPDDLLPPQCLLIAELSQVSEHAHLRPLCSLRAIALCVVLSLT